MNHADYTYKPLDSAGGERHVNDARAWYLKPSVYWLLPVFILFNVSMGALAMPRNNLIISLTCRNVLLEMLSSVPVAGDVQGRQIVREMMGGGASDAGSPPPTNVSIAAIVIGEHNNQCSIKEVESATALLVLWGNLIAGILGAITTPVWGRMSDRYGRMKPLAAAATIMLLSQLIEVLMAELPDLFSLRWLWLSFVFEGLSGTFILIMALGSAYAGDCTLVSQRSITMGLLHGSMYFGMAFGPVFGGFISMSGGAHRPLVIFYTSLAINAIGVIYILFLVPESLSLTNVQESSITSLQNHRHRVPRSMGVLDLLQLLNPLRVISGLVPAEASSDPLLRRNLITLATLNTLIFATAMAGMNVIMLYSEYTFRWDNRASGIFLSSVNIARATTLVLLLPSAVWLYNRYIPPDSSLNSLDLLLIRISIFSDIIGYIGYATAPNGVLFTLAGVIAALDSVALAVSEATLSKLAGRARMGEVLGALGFLQACARIVGPSVSGIVYSQTIASRPNLVFWGFAVIFAIAGLITFVAKLGQGRGIISKELVEDEILLEEYSSH